MTAIAHETTSHDAPYSNLENVLQLQYLLNPKVESLSPQQSANLDSPPTIHRSLSDEQKTLTPLANPQIESALSRWLLTNDTSAEEIQPGKISLCHDWNEKRAA